MRLPSGQPWTNVGPWVFASLPFVFMVAWFWNRGPGLDADDWAQTLMHAQALMEGRPYGDIPFIASGLDSAPPRQPPGLPLVVAATMTIAGGFHWTTVKLAMALAALPFMLLAGLSCARWYDKPTGLAVTVMLSVAVAATPPSAATHIQSDLGFASLVWGVLYLLDGPARLTWPRVLAVFALGSLAMAYRYLGATLVPTIALFALLRRGKASDRLMAPLGVWAAGAIGVVTLVGASIITSQVSLDPIRLWRVLRPWTNQYTGSAMQAHLYPLPWDVGNNVFHVVSLSLALIGLVVWTRASWRSAAWLFTLVYLLALLVSFNTSQRYLIPLYPVLIFGFLHGARIVIAALRPGSTDLSLGRRVAVCGAVVAFLALGRMTLQEPRTGGDLQELPDSRALFEHLELEGGPQQMRVVFIQPRVLAWSTGIPAMVLPGDPPDVTVSVFERLAITHVVVDRLELQPGRTRRMRETMAAHECRFEPSFENASFEVYRFLPECRDAS